MGKPVLGERVKTLRMGLRLSLAKLAERTGISKDSLSRIEQGRQTGTARRTQEVLAKALNVAIEVLTGVEDMPQPGPLEPSPWDAPRNQWNIRVDDSVRNAFDLTSIRYRIPVARIVELAPLLFVLVAEQSLQRRRVAVEKLELGLADMSAVAAELPHVAEHSIIGQGGSVVEAEKQLIDARDILADRLYDKLFRYFLPQDEDYSPQNDNPFVASLKAMAKSTGLAESGTAVVHSFCRDDASYEVCGKEALELAGGDKKLAAGILDGWAPLHEMPRDLLVTDASAERVVWLQGKKGEHAAAMERLMIELGIRDPSGEVSA